MANKNTSLVDLINTNKQFRSRKIDLDTYFSNGSEAKSEERKIAEDIILGFIQGSAESSKQNNAKTYIDGIKEYRKELNPKHAIEGFPKKTNGQEDIEGKKRFIIATIRTHYNEKEEDVNYEPIVEELSNLGLKINDKNIDVKGLNEFYEEKAADVEKKIEKLREYLKTNYETLKNNENRVEEIKKSQEYKQWYSAYAEMDYMNNGETIRTEIRVGEILERSLTEIQDYHVRSDAKRLGEEKINNVLNEAPKVFESSDEKNKPFKLEKRQKNDHIYQMVLEECRKAIFGDNI